MPKCRVTIQPWVELDVDDAEYAYFKTSGLLVEDGNEEPELPTGAQPSTPGSPE